MNINPLFILPNLFTVASIFLAILCVVFSSAGDFERACYVILLSAILDSLDGRVARMTGTSSKFGVELDSLADVIAFGVAPAFLLYFYIGEDFGRYGLSISAIFVILGAIRLARFNVTSISLESNSFIGLPIPAAAGVIVTLILLDLDYGIFAQIGEIWLLIFTFMVAIAMVSHIRYPSFKKMHWNLRSFILLVVLLFLVYLRPVEVLAIALNGYALYGFARFIFISFTKILLKKRRSP